MTQTVLQKGALGIAELLERSKHLRALQGLDDSQYVANGLVLANWPNHESDSAAYAAALSLLITVQVNDGPGIPVIEDELSYLRVAVAPFVRDLSELAWRPTRSMSYAIAKRVVPLADQMICFPSFNYGLREGLSRELRWWPANLESALAYILTLFLDGSLPYAESLCQCKLKSCSRLYMVDRSVPHRPNTSYCRPEHREDHNRETAAIRQRRRRERLKHK